MMGYRSRPFFARNMQCWRNYFVSLAYTFTLHSHFTFTLHSHFTHFSLFLLIVNSITGIRILIGWKPRLPALEK